MTGLALIWTKRGRCYLGHATLCDGCVEMPDAQLRHTDVHGVRFYGPAERAWSRSEWTQIRWLDADGAAVAA